MLSDFGLALLKKFFTYDPKKRITCDAALVCYTYTRSHLRIFSWTLLLLILIRVLKLAFSRVLHFYLCGLVSIPGWKKDFCFLIFRTQNTLTRVPGPSTRQCSPRGPPSQNSQPEVIKRKRAHRLSHHPVCDFCYAFWINKTVYIIMIGRLESHNNIIYPNTFT